jgi:two-component system chemotaxis response regulator CheB
MAVKAKKQVTEQFSAAAYDMVALASSAGGLRALSEILQALPADFPAALAIVQHLDPWHRSLMAEILSRRTLLPVKEAEAGDCLQPGSIYIAPPNKHFLVNPDRTAIFFIKSCAAALFLAGST